MKHGEIHVVSTSVSLPVQVSMIGINYCHSDYLNIRELSGITVLCYVLEGQGNVCIDSLAFRPKQGDVFILPKGTRHQVFTDPDQGGYWTYIWYNMEGNSLQLLEAFQLQSTLHITETRLEQMFREGLDASNQLAHDKNLLQITLLSVCTKIMVQLAANLERQKSRLSVELQAMLQYLNQLDAAQFHSSHMSRQFALSFKQINRMFKKELGTTVYDYFLMKKLNTAKMLLRDTSLAVSQIAFRIGYSDAHYFSNIFKKKTGTSPTKYRELKAGSLS
jgi:AraC family transcriptional regulator of arabinose operon